MCTRGQYQVVIADSITGGQHYATVLAVNCRRLVMQQFNALGGIKLSGAEQQIGLLDLAEQVGLGQWRPLIR
ncbi:hypothetical protein D3C78_1865230 [compost metagenome]